MPRQARLDLPGLLHHVMARGIERRSIFQSPIDYEDFLSRTAAAHERYPSQILAWALLPNHFHLLIRSGSQGLGPFMQKVMTGYATAFNLRHRRAGHLFQNRYKTVICEEESYLLELVRYIHLNPLRAGLVGNIRELETYPYCGHGVLVGVRRMDWQDEGEVLSRFSPREKVARRKYAAFVFGARHQGKRSDLTGGGLIRSMGGIRRALENGRAGNKEAYDSRILGSGSFVESILKAAETQETLQRSLARRGIGLPEMAERVAQEFHLPSPVLFQRGRSEPVSRAKALLIYLGVEFLEKSTREMALLTKMTDSAAVRAKWRGLNLMDSTDIAEWLKVN